MSKEAGPSPAGLEYMALLDGEWVDSPLLVVAAAENDEEEPTIAELATRAGEWVAVTYEPPTPAQIGRGRVGKECL